MCGIFFSCNQEAHQPPGISLSESLQKRGPDWIGSVSPTVILDSIASRESISTTHKRIYFLTFLSTVLSLRGSSIVKQPLTDLESGSLLCWNGEAWKIDNQLVQGNDAEHVFQVLLNATTSRSDNSDNIIASKNHSLQGVIDTLSSITGPYAFVFYDAPHHQVFYGRDVLGRRSLLVKRCSTTSMALSSIRDPADSEDWIEVEADGVYVRDLTVEVEPSSSSNQDIHIPWVSDQSKSMLNRTLVPSISPFFKVVLSIDSC